MKNQVERIIKPCCLTRSGVAFGTNLIFLWLVDAARSGNSALRIVHPVHGLLRAR